jgi:hypothetical protein
MLYEIQPDEALILERPLVAARYWGIQLGVWMQTTDYSQRQSSIIGAQARLDSDGWFRAVMALHDPGVPNWLDPAGVPIGVVLLRWYKVADCIVPTATRVKLAGVRRHLPGDTPVVAEQQRRAQLEARRCPGTASESRGVLRARFSPITGRSLRAC